MKIKKMIAAVAAAAVTVSMAAVNAFAATVALDDSYPGAWQSTKCIPKSELTAIGGDVKIVLDLETYDPIGAADQFVFRPMDYDNGWADLSGSCTSDTVVAKTDGMFCVPKGTTSLEFVLSESAIQGLGDSGVGFQVSAVFIKSAELSAGTPQGEIPRVTDQQGKDYCFGKYTPERATAAAEEPAADDTSAEAEEATAAVDETPAETPAADETPAAEAEEVTVDETPAAAETVAPAADSTPAPAADTAATAPAATGNVPAAVMVSVMAVAGAAVVASRKRK